MLFLFFSCLASQGVDSITETGIETITETEIITETITEIVEEEVCATLEGRIVCDFDAINEIGADVHFYGLAGKPVILDISAMWCGPCQAAAQEVQEVQDRYSSITYLTLLIENLSGDPPTSNDLELWKDEFGIETAPTWGGSRELITGDPTEIENKLFLSGWPTFYLLDEDLRIIDYQRGFSSEIIEEWAQLIQ